MRDKYLFFIVTVLLMFEISFAKSIMDCRGVLGSTAECNPYSSQLIRAKNIHYKSSRRHPIVSKIMPVPKKHKIKIISVEDLIERHIRIEDPLRFKLPLDTESKKDNTDNNTTKKSIAKASSVSKKKEKKIYVRYGKYSILKGDSIATIAKKFTVSKKELLRINFLEDSSKLKVGQKLRIPLEQKVIDAIDQGEYIIESGDSIHSIAKRFKIKTNELESINNIHADTIIKVGKVLKLPFKKASKKDIQTKTKNSKSIVKNKNTTFAKKTNRTKKHKNVKKLRTFGKRKLRVTATAYSSHKNQTDSTPFLAAWNNRLRPGMKIIAVSRDLLTKYGMKNGTRVRIGGLPGYYHVRDKMNKRYKKRIDIYMGVNRRRAFRWGRRSVVIYW